LFCQSNERAFLCSYGFNHSDVKQSITLFVLDFLFHFI